MLPTLLSRVRLLDPATGRDETIDLLLDGSGGIEAVSVVPMTPPDGVRVLMAGRELPADAVVCPGLVDMHVHLREPGQTHKETVASGARAAALGGFTRVACMPNTAPALDSAALVRWVRMQAAELPVEVHPIGAVSLGRKGETLAPLAELADAGAVAFTDDGDPVWDSRLMRAALETAAELGRPIIQHAEDKRLTLGAPLNEGEVSRRLGLPGWPAAAEEVVVARDAILTHHFGGRVHVAHLSTAGTVEIVRRAKRDGIAMTCEVAPHHFCLTDRAVERFGSGAKMNPPLRTDADIAAIRAGLADGTIDAIATDHAPHAADEKARPLPDAAFGIIGLETALSLCLEHLVQPGVLSLIGLIDKLTTAPRRILNLPQPSFAVGSVAELTLFSPSLGWTVGPDTLGSLSHNTPFLGTALTGRALGTLHRNRPTGCLA